MIEARGLVKPYGSPIAVDNLSFDVMPGTVTGFLGPNGAGKSPTMRMMLGLDRPDSGPAPPDGKDHPPPMRMPRGLARPHSGTVRITGKHYRALRSPLREAGALLEAKACPPGRS